MTLFTEANATEVVKARHEKAASPRVKQLLDSIVTHLHAVVREVEPTQAEWERAIGFLTRTGHLSDDKRQEFILLSDVLGVSMLVDAINNRRIDGGSESTVLGPFHVKGVEHLPMGASISKDGKGEPLFLSGRITDTVGKPIEGAILDIWQTSAEGFYDVQDSSQPQDNLRGVFTTGADGRYWFRSVKPSSYPIPDDGTVGDLLKAAGRHPMRPAHVHFMISAPGYKGLTTHVFVNGDRYLASDAVFGVKDSLVIDFKRSEDAARAAEIGLKPPFFEATYNFALVPVNRSM